jgi:DNA-binding transcriptional MerR regulator
MVDRLSIGAVARGAGLGVGTVRFYEKQGLIPKPPRTPAGYREYPGETVARLKFIQRAKALGFSLREINELLGLHRSQAGGVGRVRARAEEKVREIERRMGDLERVRLKLLELIEACQRGRVVGQCAILAALADGEDGA